MSEESLDLRWSRRAELPADLGAEMHAQTGFSTPSPDWVRPFFFATWFTHP